MRATSAVTATTPATTRAAFSLMVRGKLKIWRMSLLRVWGSAAGAGSRRADLRRWTSAVALVEGAEARLPAGVDRQHLAQADDLQRVGNRWVRRHQHEPS